MSKQNKRDAEETGEVVSFADASHPHVHARKEKKFDRLRSAFKAITDEKFPGKQKRGKKNKKKGKKR
ncbi:MAG: hypothetical protein AAF412_11995 [Pseudomonadota bacterium]